MKAPLSASGKPSKSPIPPRARLKGFSPGLGNPGALGAHAYIPANLRPGAALVVVLHGCTQSAAQYDAGAGWSRLADRAGFALLFPEQRRANNANLCFNWFEATDIARYGGEAESIAQMVEVMVGLHALDRQRIFITGLSAGGAMAGVMLATYPDVFAGGAIIGGLPYGCARGVGAALERMGRRNGIGPNTRTANVEDASGLVPLRWPTVSIWHGTADATVAVGNMDDLAAQWSAVHRVGAIDPDLERGANWERRRWKSGERTVVETWRISGMGHGVPVDPQGSQGLGIVGPYMLAVGIDSTALIARAWDIIPGSIDATEAPLAVRLAPKIVEKAVANDPPAAAARRGRQPASGIQEMIEDALRSAGLMK